MVSASAPIPAMRCRRRRVRLGEIKWDGATGAYLVVDRAQDMFFVVLQNAPSGRLHVQVNVKKLIYDAFEK